MATVLLLSGGIGRRMKEAIPKQYILIKGKPIIGYCLDTIQKSQCVDKIVIVSSPNWYSFLSDYIHENHISKFAGFVPGGKSRQHSILNGLKAICKAGVSDFEPVVIHDAARPNITEEMLSACVATLDEYDMSMPVISVKDTVYYSDNGKSVSRLCNRDTLYAGQTPEGCHFKTYYEIHSQMSDAELAAVRGTSELGFRYGLSVGFFPGAESNYKITTQEDMERFKLQRLTESSGKR